MEPKNNKKTVWVWGAIFILIVVSASFYYDRADAYAELEKLKFVPIPEGYTELYFKDPSSLPQQAMTGETVSFSFVIHNMEDATTTYPYDVYFEDQSGQRTFVTQGSVTLDNNDSNTINLGYTFPGPIATTSITIAKGKKSPKQDLAPTPVPVMGEMVVELTSLDQQIDFLLPQNNS